MKSNKQKFIDDICTCAQCGEHIKTVYVIVFPNTQLRPEGNFCSDQCANNAMWGPFYVRAKTQKLGELKVEIT